ncbi:MAG: hypothetical protein KC656_29515, partial [Myxococcales bacterium]|nr:hypothetical protein [Myxococcales bacterium]
GARALETAALLADLGSFERLLDLHTALRLLETSPETPAEAWRVVAQNRGKARGRLRALVARETAWLPALLALDALGARSAAAIARFAWSWAWQELAVDFPFDPDRPVTPPCEALPADFVPLDEAGRAPLPTWVLLVVLKGRDLHLERWVATGGTGDRDSTWARLMKDLPSGLAYPAVRHALAELLPELLAAHRPVLERLAALPGGRTLKTDTTALLAPGWHPDVPFPRAGFPTFVAHAGSFLGRRREDER